MGGICNASSTRKVALCPGSDCCIVHGFGTAGPLPSRLVLSALEFGTSGASDLHARAPACISVHVDLFGVPRPEIICSLKLKSPYPAPDHMRCTETTLFLMQQSQRATSAHRCSSNCNAFVHMTEPPEAAKVEEERAAEASFRVSLRVMRVQHQGGASDSRAQ